MTTTPAAADLPREIRATIHEDAIQRVTRFFDATLRDCLNELLQNSRRAGATRIDVGITAGGAIELSDDGRGIDNPQALLSFGMSQWDQHVSSNEDPAGMGVYALSRMREVSITSKSAATGKAWRVELRPEHFTGAESASIQELDLPERGPGTTVAFRPANTERAKEIEREVAEAAKYYPLPVHVNGDEVERKDFLHQCFHIEEWEGVRIGVTHEHRYYRGPAINFHGLTIESNVNARMGCRDTHWNTLIDVINCPRLELTLPARKDLVQNDFVPELKQRCRQVAYRAMAQAKPPANVSYRQQQDAAELGVAIPDAQPELYEWVAEHAENERNSNRRRDDRTTRARVSTDCVRMDEFLDSWDQQGLARALEEKLLPAMLREPENEMAGYGWYDGMTAVTKVEIHVHQADGQIWDLNEARTGGEELDPRPERIVYRLRTRTRQGKESWVEYEGDVGFLCDNMGWEGAEISPLVTRNSRISPDELADMMIRAYFYYSDDSEADSRDTQEEHFTRQAQETARATLLSPGEAVEATMREAVHNHVRHHLPAGWNAVIYLGEDGQVDLELEQP